MCRTDPIQIGSTLTARRGTEQAQASAYAEKERMRIVREFQVNNLRKKLREQGSKVMELSLIHI